MDKAYFESLPEDIQSALEEAAVYAGEQIGQEVLERTACEITDQGITVRFFVGFPANGRTINAGDWRKYSLNFSRFVWKKHLYTKI